MKRFLYFIVLLTFMSTSILATEAFMLSLPGENNYPDSQDVSGARLSLLYGEANDVKGLNVPMFGLSEVDNFTGLDLGIFWGASKVNNEFKGVSIGWVNWHEGQDYGVNIGLVNFVNDVNGINFGAVNYSQGTTTVNIGLINLGMNESLLDIGLVNYSEYTTFQIGFINATKHLDGIQIGLINYAENGIFPVLPLINFRKGL